LKSTTIAGESILRMVINHQQIMSWNVAIIKKRLNLDSTILLQDQSAEVSGCAVFIILLALELCLHQGLVPPLSAVLGLNPGHHRNLPVSFGNNAELPPHPLQV